MLTLISLGLSTHVRRSAFAWSVNGMGTASPWSKDARGWVDIFKARWDGCRCCSGDGMAASSDLGRTGVGARKWRQASLTGGPSPDLEFKRFSKTDSNAQFKKYKLTSSRPPKIVENSKLIDMMIRNNFVHWTNYQFET
jgi:hypothetical protein